MKPIYIIRLNDEGYMGTMPWTPVPAEQAKQYSLMKDARRQLNRLRDRLGYPTAEIETLTPLLTSYGL